MVALVNADWAPLDGEMDIVRCSEKVLSIYITSREATTGDL